MSEWVDLFHVLSEIVLVLIIVRLQYELFCVRTAIQKFQWFVEDLHRQGSSKTASASVSTNVGDTSIVEKRKE